MAERLGERVRLARERLGISGVQLSRTVGITNSYLSDLEHGKRPLRAGLARRLAVALDGPADHWARLAAEELLGEFEDGLDYVAYVHRLELLSSAIRGYLDVHRATTVHTRPGHPPEQRPCACDFCDTLDRCVRDVC